MKHQSIAVVTKYFYPVTAGIETNILETYSVLTSKNIDVTIHTSRDEYIEKNKLRESETIRKLKVKRYTFINEVVGFGINVDWEKTDIVALHNFNVFFWRYFVIVAIHKLLGKKTYRLIVTPHGGFCPQWSMFPIVPRILKYLYHWIIGSVCINLLADEVRAVSDWEKMQMVKLGVRKNLITTITNGLENEAFMNVDTLASAEAKTLVKNLGSYMIQIGRIYPIKNYETVIRALAHVPNIKYLIIGQEEKSAQYKNYKQSLIDLAKKLKVEHRVIFGGILRGADKYYVIKHAALMVHMALWESFCNVVHEGMSQGRVCVVANNTALPLLIKNKVNGYTVDTHDSDGLSRKINFVLDPKHKHIIEEIEQRNKAIGLQDSWANVADHMYQLYFRKNV